MVGPTDSPCLKVKPQPEINRHKYVQLGVEVYGGLLLNPWFDRDLSLAGRVDYQDKKGALCYALINFERPIAVIPSLAIHLDHQANENRSVNAQTYLPPILSQTLEGKCFDLKKFLLEHLKKELKIRDAEKIPGL